jgi:hypothetical protein
MATSFRINWAQDMRHPSEPKTGYFGTECETVLRKKEGMGHKASKGSNTSIPPFRLISLFIHSSRRTDLA